MDVGASPIRPLACKHLTHPRPGTGELAKAATLPGCCPAQALLGQEGAQLLHWLLSKQLDPLYIFIPN